MDEKRGAPDGQPEAWEQHLRQGLDALSDLGAEQPPNVAAMQMLVAEVQREERARARRDLGLFLGAAVLVLTGVLASALRMPALFLTLQGVAVLALLLAAGIGMGAARQGRVER